jgi:hypothetical protein
MQRIGRGVRIERFKFLFGGLKLIAPDDFFVGGKDV